MTSATAGQLSALHVFLADRRPGEPWRRDGNRAVLEVAVSAGCRSWLTLTPVGLGAGSQPLWLARRFDDSPDGDPRSQTEGALEQCTLWLERRHEELKRLSSAAAEVQEFAAGRPGWTFKDKQVSRIGASRIYDFPEVHEQVGLFVRAESQRRMPMTASVSLRFCEGAEHGFSGESPEVTAWLKEWEQCLGLPARLRDCDTHSDALDIVDEAPRKHLFQLAHLFEWPNTVTLKAKLIRTFAPPRARVA